MQKRLKSENNTAPHVVSSPPDSHQTKTLKLPDESNITNKKKQILLETTESPHGATIQVRSGSEQPPQAPSGTHVTFSTIQEMLDRNNIAPNVILLFPDSRQKDTPENENSTKKNKINSQIRLSTCSRSGRLAENQNEFF
jgi:hypothetical protein